MNITRSSGVKEKFQSCLLNENFEEIKIDTNRKHVNFALLKLNANRFDYNKFINYLKNASIFYALPKERIEKLQEDGLIRQIFDEASSKFRKSVYNDGEGGELISYCINEDVLGAPKILSKLKLKTNSNDYVKGADGVHLLSIDENNYEIILAESKMYKTLDDAIDAAFKSVDRFISGDSLEFEITTLATNMSGEFEDIDVDYLSRVILPSKGTVRSNTAFSIFIGFEVSDSIDKSLNYEEYENAIKAHVQKYIEDSLSKINAKFKDDKRLSYSFYIYLIPFMEIESLRKNIIEKVRGNK